MSDSYKSKRGSKRFDKRGKRNDSSSNGRRDDERQFESKGKRGRGLGNDPAWYTVPGQLTKDVASLSFNNASGITYQMDPTDSNSKMVTPGIMSIYMGMVPGVGNSSASALNVAAKNIYAYVRHANSGHSNYDSPDLMMYILAMDSAFAYYAWMARIYGMMRVYDQRNRYLGNRMVSACGVDPITIDLASFRAYINQYAVKLGAFNVPASMSLYKRHTWMFSSVYADEDDMKAQFYMYQPAYVYLYDDVNGVLKPQSLCLRAADTFSNTYTTIKTGMTQTQIMSLGDLIIQNLAGSEDINIMSGDILKAYGNDVFRLSLIEENYATIPIFSEEVLSQIHNTTFVGGRFYNGDSTSTDVMDVFTITQQGTPGYGYLSVSVKAELGGSASLNKFLDFWKTDITPDDVMVATRNMVFTYYDTATKAYNIETCGTEIPIFASIWTANATNPLVWTWTAIAFQDRKATTLANLESRISQDNLMGYFNEHPRITYGTYDTDMKYTVDTTMYRGELSNFTVVNFEDIRKMHDTALLSMLAVPLLGNVARG